MSAALAIARRGRVRRRIQPVALAQSKSHALALAVALARHARSGDDCRAAGGELVQPESQCTGTNGWVTWTNADGVTHRIVANDGSFDTGNIAPGETSAAMTVATDGARYHCSIHPSMVGAVNSHRRQHAAVHGAVLLRRSSRTGEIRELENAS